MNGSLLPAYAVFSSIALVSAFAYLALCRGAQTAERLARRFRPPRPVSCRPGEVVHQALKLTGRRYDHLCTAAIVFAVAMSILCVFGRRDWWPDLAFWAFALLTAGTSAVQLFGIVYIVQLARYRVRLSRLLDRHLAMARRLADAQLRGNRVYHSVALGGEVIDNVVVGPNGVYTVHLFAPPDKSAATASLQAGALVFQPGDRRIDLGRYRRTIAQFAGALGERVGSPITVLPVIAVADCRIEPSDETMPMVVSLESCTSFVGWKDQQAYLMADELEAINRWLAQRIFETHRDSLRELHTCLDPLVERPLLV